MLSKEDKKWIAEVISKVKSNKDEKPISSKSSITDAKELIRKRQQNAETLSERIELEKLKLKRQLTKPIRDARKALNKTKQDVVKKLVPNKDARKVIGIAGNTAGRATSAVTKGVVGAAGTLAGGAVSGTVGAVRNTVNAVKSSKLGSSAIEALMYSNPITAAIYMNKDLMKGLTGGVKGFIDGTKNILGTGLKAAKQLGGGLWQGTKEVGKGIFETASYFYGKNKNKYQPKKKAIPGQQQALIPGQQNALIPVDGQRQLSQNNVKLFMAKDGTNYILTKTAIFMGGKNYLNVTAQPKKASGGFLPGPNAPALPGPNIPALPAPKLLPGPKSSKKKDDDVIEMTKGINGIYEQTKKSNKLLDKLGKKQLLIAVGVLAAVAGIAGLAILVKSLIEKNKVPPTPKITPTQQAESFREQATTPAEEIQNKIQEGINQETHVSKFDEFQKVTPENLGVLGNINTRIRSGYQAESKEGSVYRAPFNMKVKDWKENNKKLGVVNIIAEKIVRLGINKDIEIMNVKDPIVFPGDMVTAGQPIGLVGPGGIIHIKDISKEDMIDYVKLINKFADSQDKQEYNITPEIIDKRQKYLEKLAISKDIFPDKPAKVNDDMSNTAVDIKSGQYSNSKKIVNKINQAIKDNKDGVYIDTAFGKKWIDKKDFPEWLETHSNITKQYEKTAPKYNYGNKNTEKAKQQIQKDTQRQQETQSKKSEAPKVATVKPVTLHQSGKASSRWFAPQEPVDISAMYQDRISLV